MKKVMCINDRNQWWSHTSLLPTNGPRYGEICTVLNEICEGGPMGYVLDGYGEEPYYAGLFIPLSNSVMAIEEEMELVNS